MVLMLHWILPDSLAQTNGGTTMTLLTAVIVVALLATAAALVGGIASMVQGGEYDQRHSHQFMFARVGLQGLTLVLLLVALYVAAR